MRIQVRGDVKPIKFAVLRYIVSQYYTNRAHTYYSSLAFSRLYAVDSLYPLYDVADTSFVKAAKEKDFVIFLTL